MTYTYDHADRLLTAVRGGLTTALTYDKAGRKLTMNDPDMGYWSYAYDGLGNLATQTDARSCMTTLSYDLLNRLTRKEFSGCTPSTPTIDYYYDGISFSFDSQNYGGATNQAGYRTGMKVNGSNAATWGYDTRGRVISEQRVFAGVPTPYTTSWTYNPADLPVTMTYPDGEGVTVTYNNRMLPNTVIGTAQYVKPDANGNGSYYDAAGRLTARLLGSGLTQKFVYRPWDEQGGGLQVLAAGLGAWDPANLTFPTPRLRLAYSYDAAGNITQIVNSDASGETQAYTYDALNRLTSAAATTGPAPYSESYSYDASTGNLASKAGVNYSYQPAHLHAVTSAGGSYTYDANGNMKTRPVNGQTYTLDYDAEGHLVSVSGGSYSAQFKYDGDGKRVKSIINNVNTFFVGNYYEKTGSTVTKYYYAGATRIAVRTGSTLTYLLGDHLGSTSVVTDSNGALLMETRYKPFGEVRYATTGQTLPTRYTFTGQYSYVSDEATDAAGFGLMYFNARWVDPWLGRFAQADTIIPGAGNPQAWDRYAFANNNPVRYTDPSGHAACEGENGECSTSRYDYETSTQPGGDNWWGDDSAANWWVEAGAGFSPTNSGWHNYATGPNLVCAAAWNCTQAEMSDYLSRFAYPGQDPSQPIVSGGTYSVHSPWGNIDMGPLGEIVTDVSDDGLQSVNQTLPTHAFYNGVAVRTVFQGVDNAWYVTTHSYGNNIYGTAGLNQWQGPRIFSTLDQQMLSYVSAVHNPTGIR